MCAELADSINGGGGREREIRTKNYGECMKTHTYQKMGTISV